MTMHVDELQVQLSQAFEAPQARVLSESITAANANLVRKEDLNELTDMVRHLAVRMDQMVDAQMHTDQRIEQLIELQARSEQRIDVLSVRVDHLSVRMDQFSERVDRNTERIDHLSERVDAIRERVDAIRERVDRNTERIDHLSEQVDAIRERVDRNTERIDTLAGSINKLSSTVQDLERSLAETRRDIGGIGHSIGYALENEAYRILPAYLAQHHGITLTKRLIRTEIGGLEINLYGEGTTSDGKDVVVVGEAKMRIDERRRARGKDVFEELSDKLDAVRPTAGQRTLLPLLVTHYITATALEIAQNQGIIVVQSFAWEAARTGDTPHSA